MKNGKVKLATKLVRSALLLGTLAVVHFSFSYWLLHRDFVLKTKQQTPINQLQNQTQTLDQVMHDYLGSRANEIVGQGLDLNQQELVGASLVIAGAGSDVDELHGHAFLKIDVCTKFEAHSCLKQTSYAITFFSSALDAKWWQRLFVSQTAVLQVRDFNSFVETYQKSNRAIFLMPLKSNQEELEALARRLRLLITVSQHPNRETLNWNGLTKNCAVWTRYLILGNFDVGIGKRISLWGYTPLDLQNELNF